ncbi:uncharacterized protein YgbK (DUF1537 family) [Ilumatobacter fluminis]|uniref:Uncharacterized protein YgbK (DUF1537 family) n=1 Tax=Ilumatobacter fluminis TaxID=467091 RepID=A0A4R7HWR8_9ACTN|nr:four-carbon acid sugar kinase family protein [Ilumatobacter fluminis]TDT14919.1 uncharacterized protein YgbK (DUF1537 family) [Ilumatobacter fluminis]
MAVPRVGFVGDDFTGSTDALESLYLGGIDAELLVDGTELSLPTERRASVGIATTARTWSPEQMWDRLPSSFAALRDAGADLCHYKVCSTFDSSPTIGSIGTAIEIGIEVLDADVVPVVIGTPPLGRAVVYGNLFARANGAMYRIDRHPTMSRHPVTPMDESDLRRHLERQTARTVGSVDIDVLSRGVEVALEAIDDERRSGRNIIVFDTVDDDHLRTIGRVLLHLARRTRTFVVGSSAVERAVGLASGASALPSPVPPVDQILVMSGSASPVTASQIEYARSIGYCTIRVEPTALDIESLLDLGRAAWSRGNSVIYYSALGPDDPSLRSSSGTRGPDISTRLGDAQADIVRRFLDSIEVSRLCVSGGDTCGRVVRDLGLNSLRILASVEPGGPLCLASSAHLGTDGLTVALKGGQVGSDDYFELVRRGGPTTSPALTLKDSP